MSELVATDAKSSGVLIDRKTLKALTRRGGRVASGGMRW